MGDSGETSSRHNIIYKEYVYNKAIDYVNEDNMWGQWGVKDGWVRNKNKMATRLMMTT